MNEWDAWFETKTMAVHRLSHETEDNETTSTEEELYAALPVAVAGRQNDLQHTILGDFALGEYQVYVREDDIGEDGWPVVGDRVVLDGVSYSIQKIEDHTKSPAIFTIPRHKVYDLTQDL